MTTPAPLSSRIVGDATTTNPSAGDKSVSLDVATLARMERCADLACGAFGSHAVQIIELAARHTTDRARQAFSTEADRR